MVQSSHEEEEGVSMMSVLILHWCTDHTELEDVTELTCVPKKKDIMKVPLIPEAVTSGSQ